MTLLCASAELPRARINAEMTGDFPLIIGFIFHLFLDKPYSMPSEHVEYGMSCMGWFYVCKKIVQFIKCKHFFVFDNVFLLWSEKKIR